MVLSIVQVKLNAAPFFKKGRDRVDRAGCVGQDLAGVAKIAK